MKISLVILGTLCCLLAGYALICETKNAQHAYEWGIPKDDDTPVTLLEKARWCLSYEERTIKWRRAFMISLVCAGLIDLFNGRLPTAKEFMLKFIVIYIGYSMMWYSYVGNVASKSAALGKKCLGLVRVQPSKSLLESLINV